MEEKEQELLKEVLKPNDRVLLLELKLRGKTAKLALMVRLQEGKTKVVGFRD